MPFLSRRSVARTSIALVAPLLALLACSTGDEPAVRPASAADSQAAHVAQVVASGGVVDSIHPVAESLRRFRETAPARVDTLSHASRSIDSLVARWARAVSTRDTADLNRMVLSRAEFAWLYYPDARMAKPPYEAPPDLLWSQILTGSDEGARRMLGRHGGTALAVRAIGCPDSVEVEGANRVRQNCTVSLGAGTASLPVTRYFGSIIEREGRFKFISLANRL